MNERTYYKMKLAFVFSKLSATIRPRRGDRKKWSRRAAFDEIIFQLFGIEELSSQVLYARNFKKAAEVAGDIDFEALFRLCDDPKYCDCFTQTIRMYLDIEKLEMRIKRAHENNRYPETGVERDYKELKSLYKRAIKLLQKFNGNDHFDGDELLSRYGALGSALSKKRKKKQQWDDWDIDSSDEYDDIYDWGDTDGAPFTVSFVDAFDDEYDYDGDDIPPKQYNRGGNKSSVTNFDRFVNNRGYNSPRETYQKRRKKKTLLDDDDDSDPVMVNTSPQQEKTSNSDKKDSKLESILEKLVELLSKKDSGDNSNSSNRNQQMAASNMQYQQGYTATIPPIQPQPYQANPQSDPFSMILERLDKLEKKSDEKKAEKKAKKLKKRLEADYAKHDPYDDDDDWDYGYPETQEEAGYMGWEILYKRGERRLSVLVTSYFEQFANEMGIADDAGRQRILEYAPGHLNMIYRSEGVIEDMNLEKAMEFASKKFIGSGEEKGKNCVISQTSNSNSPRKNARGLDERDTTQQSTSENLDETEKNLTMKEWSEILNSVSNGDSPEPEDVLPVVTIDETDEPRNTVDDFNSQL